MYGVMALSCDVVTKRTEKKLNFNRILKHLLQNVIEIKIFWIKLQLRTQALLALLMSELNIVLMSNSIIQQATHYNKIKCFHEGRQNSRFLTPFKTKIIYINLKAWLLPSDNRHSMTISVLLQWPHHGRKEKKTTNQLKSKMNFKNSNKLCTVTWHT